MRPPILSVLAPLLGVGTGVAVALIDTPLVLFAAFGILFVVAALLVYRDRAVPWLLIPALVFYAPWSLQLLTIRSMEIVIVILFGYSIMKGRRLIPSTSFAVWLCWLIAALLSFLVSPEPRQVFNYLRFIVIEGAMVVLIVSTNDFGGRNKEQFLKAITFTTIALTVSEIVRVITSHGGRVQGPFEHYSFAGMFYVGVLPVISFPAIARRRSFDRLISLLGTVSALAGLALTSSRAAWVSSLPGIAAVLVLSRIRWLTLIVTLGLLVVLVPWMSDPLGRLTSIWQFDNYLTVGRLHLWRDSLQLIKSLPPYGTGIGGFQNAFAHSALSSAVIYKHGHNLYLNTVVEMGIPGAVVLFFGLGVLVYTIHKRLRTLSETESRLFYILGVTGLLGMLVGSLFDDPFYSSTISYSFFVILGLVIGGKAHEDSTTMARSVPVGSPHRKDVSYVSSSGLGRARACPKSR